MPGVKEAMLRRRSSSKVTDAAPNHAEVAAYVETAGQLADHSGLRPWRVIEIRGDARNTLGDALAKADGAKGKDAEKFRGKAHRAPLVLAIVASFKPSHKVPHWEQEAVAAGVAHGLTLLLDDEGWGVFWRSGELTRTDAVRSAHELGKYEELLGWLYVGGLPAGGKRDRPKGRIRVGDHLSVL
ncbi:nitroreductase family protein [Herbiconiux daphne]|uniref:Putative NAD(P)H nitroreductase n=1 Tax=Herbiconiux daphne TaxID=2970914 RepID=A0ABT2GXP2_9MICO|nr:nitroreductase family protein [Herbiconiux daphne]MCS5732720.1 nitroreductase family protein [Herbiconiux daphne]